MGLKKLIDKQTIIIDDHKRGNGEVKNWDNPSVDVHIDKSTQFPLNGKIQEVRIRVPINSNRPISILKGNKKTLGEIPRTLRREIQDAFEDKTTREAFILDVVAILKNWDSALDNQERAKQVIGNISKHFNLGWPVDTISSYAGNALSSYTNYYEDQLGTEYFVTLNRDSIKIAENTKKNRQSRKNSPPLLLRVGYPSLSATNSRRL